jgi:hypothetical protein
MGLSIIIVLSLQCAAGPGGRSDGTGAPRCALASPANGSLARGTVEVCGTAVKGSLPLTAVLVRVDGGAWKHADGLENWTLSIDTTLLVDGEHTIFARAEDANLSSENVSVVVLVRNPGPPVSSGFDLMCLVNIIITAGLVAMVVLAARERRRM